MYNISMISLQEFRSSLEDVLTYTRDNLASIRTGRASPALVENISVTTYGGQATLKVIELATITTSGPQEILVSPFDQSTLQDIEKAIRDSSLGFSVSVSGTQIRAKTPPLSQEQREKYVKLVTQFAEEGRETLRHERDEIRKKVKTTFEAKELSEDEKRRAETDIDKVAKEYTDKIDEMKGRKEQEVMTV
jgi:ribosome recycling factor